MCHSQHRNTPTPTASPWPTCTPIVATGSLDNMIRATTIAMGGTNAGIASATSVQNDPFLAQRSATSVKNIRRRYGIWLQNDTLRRKRARELRHLGEKNVRRFRNDALSRSRSSKEREATPKRELGTRVDGAFHDRDRQLYRAGHSRAIQWLPCQLEYTVISICPVSTTTPVRKRLSALSGPLDGTILSSRCYKSGVPRNLFGEKSGAILSNSHPSRREPARWPVASGPHNSEIQAVSRDF